MKKAFNAVYFVLEIIGKAKAAAYLSRQGRHEEAKALLLAD